MSDREYDTGVGLAEPRHGGNRDYNYIKQIFTQHCGVTDPSIIVVAALEAAIPTLVELSEYTCNDLLKMRAGHTWGIAGALQKELTSGRAGHDQVKLHPRDKTPTKHFFRCGRVLKGKSPATTQFGTKINAVSILPPKQIDKFKWTYDLTLAGLTEGLLFRFFLFEIGKKFVINWMTLAYAMEGCDLPPAGSITTTYGFLCSTPGPVPATAFIAPATVECASTGGHEIHIPPGCQATISWRGTWKPFGNRPGNAGNVTMWLEDDSGKQYDVTEGKYSAKQGGVVQGGGLPNVRGAVPVGTTFRLKARIESGLMCIDDGTLFVQSGGRPVHFFPTGGCGAQTGHANTVNDPLVPQAAKDWVNGKFGWVGEKLFE